MGYPPLPSRRPKSHWKCYATPAFSGVPNAKHGERIRMGEWAIHPCLLGGPKEGKSAMQPLHSRGSPTPSAWRKSEVAIHPCLLGGPKEGGSHGGATTTGPDATYPPAICQNSGGGGGGGRVWGGSGRGSGGGPGRGSGGGLKPGVGGGPAGGRGGGSGRGSGGRWMG